MVSNIHDTTFFIKHIQDFFFFLFTFFSPTPQPACYSRCSPTKVFCRSLKVPCTLDLGSFSVPYVAEASSSTSCWGEILGYSIKNIFFPFRTNTFLSNGLIPISLKCCDKATGIRRHMGLPSQLRLLLWFDFTFRRKLSVPFISLADCGTEHNMLSRNIRNGIKSAKMYSFIQTKKKKRTLER